jgi:hypothetical protein
MESLAARRCILRRGDELPLANAEKEENHHPLIVTERGKVTVMSTPPRDCFRNDWPN